MFDVLFILFSAITGNTLGRLRSKLITVMIAKFWGATSYILENVCK